MTRWRNRLETASKWSKAVNLVVLNGVLLFTMGCASTGKVEPIAQRLPRGSSCVALVSIPTKRQLTAGVPTLKYGPKEEGARFVGLGPINSISDSHEVGAAAPGLLPVLVAVVAWIPPGWIIGSAYGAATGVQDSEIQAAIQSAGKFVNHYDFEAELVRKVSDNLWTGHKIGLNSFTLNGAELSSITNGPKLTYDSLRQRGFRHVIELEVGTASLSGDYERRNPRVGFQVDVTAMLCRIDGSRREQLHSVQVHYCSDKQRFVRWMADDAKALRAELDKCQRTIAAQILEAFVE